MFVFERGFDNAAGRTPFLLFHNLTPLRLLRMLILNTFSSNGTSGVHRGKLTILFVLKEWRVHLS